MLNELRILVCGGRDYNNKDRFFSFMDNVIETFRGTEETSRLDVVLIHGAARGADSLADYYGRERGLRIRQYPADWETHGRSAGPIRNQKMLTESEPHVIVAFKGGKGTAHMVSIGKKAGVPVYEVRDYVE